MKRKGRHIRAKVEAVNAGLRRIAANRRDAAAQTSTEDEAQGKSTPLSSQKIESEVAVDYQPHSPANRGSRFRDPRGRVYEVDKSGALRNVNKPPSRVKRERAARKTKTTDQGEL